MALPRRRLPARPHSVGQLIDDEAAGRAGRSADRGPGRDAKAAGQGADNGAGPGAPGARRPAGAGGGVGMMY